MTRKTRRLIRIFGFGGALLFFISAMWILIVWMKRPPYLKPDTSGWHTGDIFFSVGDSWESVAVRSLTGALSLELSDSTPSHCGIILRDSSGVMLVHESTLAKKIVREAPEEYLKKNGSYCLYAVKPPTRLDSSLIVHILDSLFDAEVPFDFKFDHSDSKALYCTEMVVTAHELAGDTSFSELRVNGYIYPVEILNKCSFERFPLAEVDTWR